jgi:integrase
MTKPVATGTVYKRTGAWYASYRLPGQGQRRKKLGAIWPLLTDPPQGHHNEASARAELDRILAPYADWSPDWEETLEVVAEAWLTACSRDCSIRATSVRRYGQVLATHLAPALGSMVVGSITEVQVRALRADVATRAGPSTLSQCRAVLSGAVGHLRATKGYRGPDPSAWWAYATPPAPRHVDVYEPDEVERVVAAAQSQRDATLYRTMAYAGLRVGEARALRWSDIDLDSSRIIVHAGYTDAGGDGLTKSGRERAVPIVPQLAAALILLRGAAADGDRVFCEQDGGVLNDDAVRKRLRGACARAGVRRMNPHDLRHSAACMFVQVFPIHEVQGMLGHRSILTTSRYLHMKIGEEHAERLGEWIGARI